MTKEIVIREESNYREEGDESVIREGDWRRR